ncbi:hypothetical protein BDK51DRAFT_27717, partial [Blyttiomyces helicus]
GGKEEDGKEAREVDFTSRSSMAAKLDPYSGNDRIGSRRRGLHAVAGRWGACRYEFVHHAKLDRFGHKGYLVSELANDPLTFPSIQGTQASHFKATNDINSPGEVGLDAMIRENDNDTSLALKLSPKDKTPDDFKRDLLSKAIRGLSPKAPGTQHRLTRSKLFNMYTLTIVRRHITYERIFHGAEIRHWEQARDTIRGKQMPITDVIFGLKKLPFKASNPIFFAINVEKSTDHIPSIRINQDSHRVQLLLLTGIPFMIGKDPYNPYALFHEKTKPEKYEADNHRIDTEDSTTCPRSDWTSLFVAYLEFPSPKEHPSERPTQKFDEYINRYMVTFSVCIVLAVTCYVIALFSGSIGFPFEPFLRITENTGVGNEKYAIGLSNVCALSKCGRVYAMSYGEPPPLPYLKSLCRGVFRDYFCCVPVGSSYYNPIISGVVTIDKISSTARWA